MTVFQPHAQVPFEGLDFQNLEAEKSITFIPVACEKDR